MHIVMFSGGVDSTLVAHICKLRCLDFIAVTIDNGVIHRRELEYAKRIAKMLGFRHRVLKVEILSNENFRMFSRYRCYYCKKAMLSRVVEVFGDVTILDGTNADDLKDFRPGLKANKEFGVKSPLMCFSKSEVKSMAKRLGLPNWNKPSNSCLAMRILEDISEEKLRVVEKAEYHILDLGFKFVRVRCKENKAFVEVGSDEVDKLISLRHNIVEELRRLGFEKVYLDLEGRKVY